MSHLKKFNGYSRTPIADIPCDIAFEIADSNPRMSGFRYDGGERFAISFTAGDYKFESMLVIVPGFDARAISSRPEQISEILSERLTSSITNLSLPQAS